MSERKQKLFARLFKPKDRQVKPSTSQPESHPQGSCTTKFPDGIKVLHDCPDETAMVDVCFVHGLTGDRESTWKTPGQEPWIQSLLPSKLAGARILTYGYDAYVANKSVVSCNRLIDHATNLLADLTTDRASCNATARPLIFVAHSLGGLVCKQAILLSRNTPESHLRDVFDSVKGVAFMGTPHRGSWMAGWASIPASALGLVKSTNRSLLKVLETDDQLLELLQVNFWSLIRELREAGRRLEVTCFFEELPLAVFGTVVSKNSATLEGYSAYSIHANHHEMTRFEAVDDNGFKRLVGELSRWKAQVAVATSATSLVVQETLPPPRPQFIAPSGVQHNNTGSGNQFVGSNFGGPVSFS